MPDGLNEDGAQALASLDALLGIDADPILPGHGDPWTEGVAEAVRLTGWAGSARYWCYSCRSGRGGERDAGGNAV